MIGTSIYKDIAKRTGGDIYIGVVGPVRTGKSTFIRKFMENVIIPGIDDEFERIKAQDELPQSAGGRTVMTTEPKFIPDKSVNVTVGDTVHLSAKMVDCVGYLVPDALGREEDGEVRMVNTPWSKDPMPFEEAAEMGTRKVITEHSTIGMIVTTDGTIGDIPRENYAEAEERVVKELSEIGKPFAIILNSARPDSHDAEALAVSLEEKYKAPVALVNCLELNDADIEGILEMVLSEFPITEITVEYPEWVASLERDHRIRRHITECVKEVATEVRKLSDVTGHFFNKLSEMMCSNDDFDGSEVAYVNADMGNGTVLVRMTLPDALYYKTVGDLTGLTVSSEKELLRALIDLSEVKKEYDKISAALDQAEEFGYGIVMPEMGELVLDEPEIIRQAGSYGVRIKASAESIHMIKTKIETEINPIIGTEEQSEEMVRFMIEEMKEDPSKVWEINMFGRSMYDLVNDGMRAKLEHMPKEAREKMSEALSRIICEGCNGLLCVIL
ncbi:MAG: stage IV sporulation protein A [Ruminococcaceae bacterium]|nr:stage IV sporulation protein A [Oscillospiraceae bacterium]